MANIHTIGDSHAAHTFRGHVEGEKEFIFYHKDGSILKVPLFIHFVGSQTMYTFGLRGCDKKFYKDLHKGDYLVYCFGEIDVRCHIYNQVQGGRKLEKIVDSLVISYIHRVQETSKKYQVNPVIFGVTPPVKKLTVDGYPSFGPFTDRVLYSKALNAKLEAASKEANILYFDVLDEYSLADGTMDMSLSDGLMHISTEFNVLATNKLCDLVWHHMQG